MIRFRYWRVSYVRMEPCTTLLTAVPTSFNVTVTLIRGWHGYCSGSLASSPIGFFCCFPPAEFGIVVAAEVEATDCFFWYRRFLASTPRPGSSCRIWGLKVVGLVEVHGGVDGMTPRPACHPKVSWGCRYIRYLHILAAIPGQTERQNETSVRSNGPVWCAHSMTYSYPMFVRDIVGKVESIVAVRVMVC